MTRQIALVSRTKQVGFEEVAVVSAALQKQVTRDFGPLWDVSATVDAFPNQQSVPVGYWPIYIDDEIDDPNAEGYHWDKHRQPYALVKYSDSWPLTASHESLEMLADPFGNRVVAGKSLKPDQGRVLYLVEVCDPCEAPMYGYQMNTREEGKQILVSDFYTQQYFEPVAVTATRYDFTGSITAPRQVLKYGYISWIDPQHGHMWQLYGPVEDGHFVDQGPVDPDRSLREHSDRSARAYRQKQLGKRDPRSAGNRPGPAAKRATAAVACVDAPEAFRAVGECSAQFEHPNPDLDQPIGEVFRGIALEGFFACVRSKTGLADVPEDSSKTFRELAIGISC